MAALPKSTFQRPFVLFCLTLLASLPRAVCDVCWPETISQESVVGFDITLNHGFVILVIEHSSSMLMLALQNISGRFPEWNFRQYRSCRS